MARNLQWLEDANNLKEQLHTRIKDFNAVQAAGDWIGSLTREAEKFKSEFQCRVERVTREFRLPEEHRTRPVPQMVYVKSPAFGAIIPGDSAAEAVLASGFLNFLNLYNSALIIRLVLTWFPNPPEVIVGPLSTLCDPYLNLFRGLIPPLGGTLDFSPILAFLVLNVFTSTAAALPAELPKEEDDAATAAGPAVNSPQPWGWIEPSEREKLWAKLTAGRRLQQSNQE